MADWTRRRLILMAASAGCAGFPAACNRTVPAKGAKPARTSTGIRIAYGSDRFQFGDLRKPEGAGRYPVVIVIHGGFWMSQYSLDLMDNCCESLTAAGYATWNIEYRRLGNPGGGWPGTLQDVGKAADYLREAAASHPLDLGRVVALGHSAGGHLALWLAGRHRIDSRSQLHGNDPLPIHGVVALAGICDLRRAFDFGAGGNAIPRLLGGRPDQVPERCQAASPEALLPLGVPQKLVHGSHDDIVPYDISRVYQRAAAEKGDAATLIRLAEARHFEVIDPKSKEWTKVLEATADLMRRVQGVGSLFQAALGNSVLSPAPGRPEKDSRPLVHGATPRVGGHTPL